MISVLVKLKFFSSKKTLSILGVTIASWKITDNIDIGSKFNSLELDKKLAIDMPFKFLLNKKIKIKLVMHWKFNN